MKKTLTNYLGLFGLVHLLSYTAAVVFSPLAYPGYNWMSQAVSDLSAAGAPSQMLWAQLSSLSGVSGVVSIMAVCIFVQGKLTRPLRTGIYLFAIMTWLSAVGYDMFPLSQSGMGGTQFQDIMHVYVVTILVVILSILSLGLIIFGGMRAKQYRALALFAAAALLFMLLGGIGVGVVPAAYFGVVERFSVFAATAFNAVLGVYLFCGFGYVKKGW